MLSSAQGFSMRDSWLDLVDCVLNPARPRLELCLREGALHRAAWRLAAEQRARAMADCERRIEAARALVFAADNGVIPSGMTELEREWRQISRWDVDGGLMDLWARIAPGAWIDRKRFRDSDPEAKLDAAIALAADAEGVDAADSAVAALRRVLAAWGTQLGARVRFRAFDADTDCVSELLAQPLRFAREAIAKGDAGPIVLERAEHLERSVYDAACARFPERPLLAHSLGHAAFVDGLLRAVAMGDRPNPIAALRELWKTGYALSAIDESGVTLEIPPLP